MIVERFGKFVRVLNPGLSFKIPIIETIAYHHSLKESVIDVNN
jgi:regulator of protease activity HflC (stomatin/prohibitin superfamily)